MSWRIAFQVAATYVGAVMGAGFASGQEIQQFFARYHSFGLMGILVSSALFALLGWIMLDLQERWRIYSYSEFFRRLFGRKWGVRADYLVSVLLFMGMLAMLSGTGALFEQYFALPRYAGIVLTAVVIALALWQRGKGVLWINTVLIPLKFAFCLGIGLIAVFFAHPGEMEGYIQPSNPVVNHWAVSAVLYVSFNLTLAMVVFASLGKEIHRRGAKLGAFLGGLALGAFALVIALALMRFPEVQGMEIPMVAVAGKLGNWPAFLYMVVLWLAMVTAAIGNAFSLVSRIGTMGWLGYAQSILLVLVLVIPLAGIKFSHLVQIGYPIFGYIGLVFLPVLFIKWIRR